MSMRCRELRNTVEVDLRQHQEQTLEMILLGHESILVELYLIQSNVCQNAMKFLIKRNKSIERGFFTSPGGELIESMKLDPQSNERLQEEQPPITKMIQEYPDGIRNSSEFQQVKRIASKAPSTFSRAESASSKVQQPIKTQLSEKIEQASMFGGNFGQQKGSRHHPQVKTVRENSAGSFGIVGPALPSMIVQRQHSDKHDTGQKLMIQTDNQGLGEADPLYNYYQQQKNQRKNVNLPESGLRKSIDTEQRQPQCNVRSSNDSLVITKKSSSGSGGTGDSIAPKRQVYQQITPFNIGQGAIQTFDGNQEYGIEPQQYQSQVNTSNSFLQNSVKHMSGLPPTVPLQALNSMVNTSINSQIQQTSFHRQSSGNFEDRKQSIDNQRVLRKQNSENVNVMNIRQSQESVNFKAVKEMMMRTSNDQKFTQPKEPQGVRRNQNQVASSSQQRRQSACRGQQEKLNEEYQEYLNKQYRFVTNQSEQNYQRDAQIQPPQYENCRGGERQDQKLSKYY